MERDRAHEDLALIRQLMADSRREVTDRGKHFLIWGLVTGVGLLSTYLYARGEAGLARALGGEWVPDPRWTWSVLLVLGWAASFLVGWRDARGARVRTLGRRLLTAVWVAAAFSMTLVAAAGMFGGALGHEALPGVLSVVMAVPILMTMVLTGERWLGWVAAGWWVGGAIMLFVPGLYTLVVMGAMSLLLLAVPGVVLNARARRQAVAEDGGAAADVA